MLQSRPGTAAASGRTATHNGVSTDGGKLHCLPHRHVNLKDRLCDIEADCRNRLHRLAPLKRGGLNSTHIHGAHAPVEEPSTASTADMRNVPRRQSDLDIARPSGNDLSMEQNNPQRALTQDEVRVGAWAEVREPLELQLAPLGRHALNALAPHPGERVLDIGCGGGETALDLARLVAPDGIVVGVDVSAAVLAFAQRTAMGCERVRFVHADAQIFPFEPASFDVAFSRFGVMFFANPTAAFMNIRRSLKSNGRLAFVCWRALEENSLDILPLRAASAHLPPQPAHDPEAPGPFAFANPDRVRGILERAGFEEIEITARDELVGSGDLDTMVAVCSRVGALGKILRENPELRAATLPAVRSALEAHDGPDGVRLNAATWIVKALAPTGL
jgi:SAM-dependent methyltransferase